MQYQVFVQHPSEQQYIGRLPQIRKAITDEALIGAYVRLKQTSLFLADLLVLDYTARANRLFRQFRSAAIRIGKDLRIAAIVLAHEGVLLTRNLRDFEKVPGSSIQNWSTE